MDKDDANHRDEDCDGHIDLSRTACPRGTHIIEGTPGNDVLRGTDGADCILGHGGNDTIYGERGNDVIFGGPGDDSIFTGRGTSIVHAGPGADTVDTSASYGSTVYGEAGEDKLIGGSGRDMFFGGDDNDVLNGGGGPDVLNGGGCHDLLIGGASFDLGTGGRDFDACDMEINAECEKTAASRVACSSDGNCQASERCAHNSGFCVPRSAAVCGGSCSPIHSVDDTCDGIDDDCDGRVDDDFPTQSVTCGAGACSASGSVSCVAGVVQNSCHAGSPQPGNVDDSCNGIDDDCDGHTDEAFVSAATSCGVGACASTGITSCVAGSVVDSCQAAAAPSTTDATCDGVDDDCDGAKDEDFVAGPSNCGLGVCASAGMASCDNGVLVDTCQAGPPNDTSDASCNGIDDNCNGAVDEDYAATYTSCGAGACQRSGTLTCVGGYEVNSCHVDCEGQCNDGAEDDGDGLIDCADSDCSQALGCAAGGVGSPCTQSSDCNPGSFCATSFPGGYCTHPCGAGCPQGTVCLGGAACVVACGPGDHCGRDGFVCSSITKIDRSVPPTLWCHPTCMFSCASGSCDPVNNLCN